MSKDVIINGTTYQGVSTVTLPVSGGTATFTDTDEISTGDLSLSGITAAYSGGSVAAGTTLSQLTGITVTASYTADGYTGSMSRIVTGYTLSGTLTAGQANTVTVAYQGKTATFTVTVDAAAGETDAGETAGSGDASTTGTETEVALTWTSAKLNYTIGGEATSTTTGAYAYAYSQLIPMESGKTYKVTTGEISALKENIRWNYRIVFVDDDNIVRATTGLLAENADNVTVANLVTEPTFESGSDVSLATGFYVREYMATSTGGNAGSPVDVGMTGLTHLYQIG
jgi:hypothetical protein